MLLQVDILLGNGQQLLLAAQGEVATGDLPGNGDLQRLQVCGAGLQIRLAGRHRPLQTTIKVRLPAGHRAERVLLDPVAARLTALDFGQALLAGTAQQGHAGPAVPTGAAQQRFSPLITCQQGLQIQVLRQRAVDQRRQLRVIEAGPEALLAVLTLVGHCIGLAEAGKRYRLRRLVIGPHRTGRQHHAEGQR